MRYAIPYLLLLIAGLLITGPVLALVAISRLRRLERYLASGSRHPETAQLAARLDALEQAWNTTAVSGPAPAAGQTFVAAASSAPGMASSPRPAPTAAAAAALPPSLKSPAGENAPATAGIPEEVENVIAGRWLHYIGIAAIFFAVAFFLQYAFQNHWVGPPARVAIGILAGGALLVWSRRLLRFGHGHFSLGIAGLGGGVLYLSLWAGWHSYRLFSPVEALAALLALTVLMVACSLDRNSQTLAALSMIGGYLAPALLSTGRDHETVLFLYLAVLSLGMLAVERVRGWRSLPVLAWIAVELHFWVWYRLYGAAGRGAAAAGHPHWFPLGETLLFAAVFYLIFAALPLVRSAAAIAGESAPPALRGGDYLLSACNLLGFLLALWMLLAPAHRWDLTLALLALSAVLLLFARRLPPARRWHQAMALLAVTMALAARFDRQWLTLAWTLEGLLLVWAGAGAPFRRRSAAPTADVPWLRNAGLGLYCLAAMRLLAALAPATRLIWNARFLDFLALALGCALAARLLSPGPDGAGHFRFRLLAAAAHAFLLLALSLEVWDYFRPLPGGSGLAAGSLNQQLALTLLWVVYATALCIVGFRRRLPLLRWQALALFGLTAFKVFFYDLSFLTRIYRVLSFLVLGLVLLLVSFAYHQRWRSQKIPVRLQR